MFDPNLYDTIAAGCLRSAQTVVPVITKLLNPRSVLDVGCGEGWWLATFAQHGCEVSGVDGGQGRLQIAQQCFFPYDLTTTPHLDLGRFDLVMSLEVAEHLPASRADWFIHELCAHGSVVLFSAAIPGQGGSGHINEQWPGYWVERFAQHGYSVSGALRWMFWDDAPDKVESWYVQNLLLAIDADELAQRWNTLNWLFDSPMAAPFPVVHPVIWDWRR